MTDAFFDAFRKQLEKHEGLRLKPYRDTVGKLTIGIGRNLDDKGITRDEALFMLRTDIAECLADLKTFPWFKGLNEVRQRVVLDMRFNLGPKGFRGFVGTLAAIEAGDYAGAATRMLASKWATQVKGRADTLADMMRTGEETT